MSSNSKEAQNDGPGHHHAKLVDEAASIMRQFNVPTCSTSLIDNILNGDLDAQSGTREWKMYHQLTDVQRLQLESLFNCVRGFDDQACRGLKGGGTRHVRSDILRSILVSLASLMFLRMSTTITMATHGKHVPDTYIRGSFGEWEHQIKKKSLTTRLPFESSKLVDKEGFASLKTDCELILKLITQLTESPEKQTQKP